LVAEHPSVGQKSTDKGKCPQATQPPKTKDAPTVVNPITAVLVPSQQPTAPVHESRHSKKKKGQGAQEG